MHKLRNTLRRNWFHSLLIFLLTASLFVGATLIWPRTYQSEAKMYVRLGRETVHLDPTATTGQMVSLADSREREIVSALELLRTRALFEEVVDELGVDKILLEPPAAGYGGVADWSHLRESVETWLPRIPSTESSTPILSDPNIADLRRREVAVRKLMQSVTSSSPKNSNVIIVQCKSSSPVTAQERLACLLRHYQNQHLRLHRTSGSFEFFDVQAQEKKSLLDGKLAELRDAKNQINVASVDGQQELLSREATAITQSLLDAEAASAASQGRLKSLLDSLSEADKPTELSKASSMSREAIDLMRSRLFDLEIEHQRLLAQLQPAHPKLKAISEQVASAKIVLKRQEVLVEQSTILEQEGKIAAAERQRSDVYGKLRELNEQGLRIADFERQADLLQAEHRKAEENREQARTDDELTRSQISNINLAQSPSFGAKPISPNVGWNLLIGMASACLGAAMVFRKAFEEDPIDIELARNGDTSPAKSKRLERQLELQI